MSPSTSPLRTLYEDTYLKLTYAEGADTGPFILACNGIGHAMGSINVQQEEFVGTSLSNGSAFFVIDKTRSWGNAVDFHRVVDTATGLIGGGEVIALGNSMGAFNAILLSSLMPVAVCVGFAPQFSVNTEVLPDETRWRRFTREVEVWRYPSLDGYFTDTTRYFLFHGDADEERRHWSRFPQRGNVSQYVIHGAGHRPAQELRSKVSG